MRESRRNWKIRAICSFALLLATALSAVRMPAGPIAPLARLSAFESPSAPAPARSGSPSPDASIEIRRVLDEQATAWNRGDVDGFIAGYWNSDQTVFAGSDGILRGWQALGERYRRSYPDRKAMGRLEFSGLEIIPLCPEAALVLGNWHLERETEPTGGVFSLVFKHLPEGWRIIADHTSVVAAPAPPGTPR